MKRYTLIAGMCVFLQISFGQIRSKQTLTPEDFDKWGTLMGENISPNGGWVTYRLIYDTGQDTLFLKSTSDSTAFAIPQGNNPIFSSDDAWFAVQNQSRTTILNLKTGVKRNVESTLRADFVFSPQLIAIGLMNGDERDLLILDPGSGHEYRIRHVKEYVISKPLNAVGYITRDNQLGVTWWDKKIMDRQILGAEVAERKNLVWNESGTSMACLEEVQAENAQMANYKIHFVKNVHGRTEKQVLDPTDEKSLAFGKNILFWPTFTPLAISPDNNRVLFYAVAGPRGEGLGKGVEIWRSTDPLEYARGKVMGDPEKRPMLTVWSPESQQLIEPTNKEFPSVYVTPAGNKAIVYDPHQYEPQSEIMSPADLWVVDLGTGKRTLFLEKQSGKLGRLGASPNGKYLNYYRDKHWWIYDIEADKHSLLTVGFSELENIDSYPGGEPHPYGYAGWTSDSRHLLLYTEYDVWLMAADGKKQEKLTNGSVDSVRYRICSDLVGNSLSLRRFYDFIGTTYNLADGLVFEAFDTTTKSSGYYTWTAKGGTKKLIMREAKLNRLKKATNKEVYVVTEQMTDLSPRMLYLDGSIDGWVVAKTNPHQEAYVWPKSALISYRNNEGVQLSGVLQYPAGYQPGKKYPMIVYIYEDQSHLLHQHYNPTRYSSSGFSPSNYALDGYFVLFPDIVYTAGKPGASAVDCVEAAVREVVAGGMVDVSRVGLIGHSFGGYETSFIVSQSNMFAAAVAGAAVTDYVNLSLTLESGSGRSRMWRFQTHQMRMGKSLYEDYEGFMANSPLTFANNITTPLLSWTGKSDPQVDPQQSMALHLAMRSLRKPHTLLQYPDEPHVLLQPDNQKDLTMKVKDWFDHYLKGTPKAEWME